MAVLQGRSPKTTFANLLTVEGGLTVSLTPVESGGGKTTPLKLSTTSISIHDLTFPSTGVAAGKVLTISADGLSMEWKTPAASSGGGGGGTVLETEADAIYYEYNDDEVVSVMTEHFGSETRVTTYSYSVTGKVDTITIEYLGQTRIETYTYINGKVTSMVASSL
jgi:hypothetical protein